MDETMIDSLPFPSVVRIEPSGSCNLSCSHCPTGTISMKRGIMSEQVFASVLRKMEPYVSSIRAAVLYHGGEPLLNKHFPQMVRSLRRLGLPFIKTVSNGMLLKENVAQDIIDSGLDAIEFSLDGKSPAENNFFRRNCDYATVVKNIKNLLDIRRKSNSARPIVYLSSTQFAQHLQDVHKPPEAPTHLLSEFAEYYGEVDFKCTWAMEWPHMDVNPDIYERLGLSGEKLTYAHLCDHLASTLTIRWNGDVVPCCYDLTSEFVVGNIKDMDLCSIWNNSRFNEIRTAIRDGQPLPLCAKCNVIRRPGVYLAIRPGVLAKLG